MSLVLVEDLTPVPKNSVEKIVKTTLPRNQQRGNIYYGNRRKIRMKSLECLVNRIKESHGQFVSPIIFVDFIKCTVFTHERITIDQDLLFKLKVWANQLRVEASAEQPDNELIDYIAYVIGESLLDFYDT